MKKRLLNLASTTILSDTDLIHVLTDPTSTAVDKKTTFGNFRDKQGTLINVKGQGVLGGGADDTNTLNTLFGNVEKSSVLFFPPEEFRFTQLIIPKPLTLKGAGWWFGHRPAFGSAGWEAPYVTEEGGTILRCTATSGIAIDAQFNTGPAGPSGHFNLQDLLLRGTGNASQTVTGVKTPGGDTGEYFEGGGLYYTADNLWENVGFGNFKIGARLYTTYTSLYKNIWLTGCDKGMQIGHEGNHLGLNTSAFINIDSMSCNIGVQCDNVGYSTFINTTIQGYYDVGLKLNWVYSSTFLQPYFEGVTGNYSIDTDDCANCLFQYGLFAGSTNGTTKMRLGANSNSNTLLCGSGFNTLILDGYRNRIIGGNPTYISGAGVWNTIEYEKDISTTTPASTNFAPAMHFPVVADKRGGLVFENGDPMLISPDGGIWRITISNAGVISGTKLIQS